MLLCPAFGDSGKYSGLMKKILVLHYSQTGQLSRFVGSVMKPLEECPTVEVIYQTLKPKVAYPFPWPIFSFFSIFPETVAMLPPEMEALDIDLDTDFDLVILAYQVWFLSPSLPTTGFLKSQAAKKLLQNRPVITLIGCRNMWLMAQEKVKTELDRLNAQLIDCAVLTDQCSAAMSFLSTPLWMFTGKKQAVSWIPKAGIDDNEIQNASRFGQAIINRIANSTEEPFSKPIFTGLGAVKINDKLIASEKIGHRSFTIWGKLMRILGPQSSLRRKCGLIFYMVFLILIILTVVPITALLRTLFAPLTKSKTQALKAYYAAPSGE